MSEFIEKLRSLADWVDNHPDILSHPLEVDALISDLEELIRQLRVDATKGDRS